MGESFAKRYLNLEYRKKDILPIPYSFLNSEQYLRMLIASNSVLLRVKIKKKPLPIYCPLNNILKLNNFFNYEIH